MREKTERVTSKNVLVTLWRDQPKLGTVRIPNIGAPRSLDPQFARVALPITPTGDIMTVTARVRPEENGREITLVNNEVTVELGLRPVRNDRS